MLYSVSPLPPRTELLKSSVHFPLRTSCWTSSVPRAGQSHEASLSGQCRVRPFVFALVTDAAALKSSILLFIFGLSLVFFVPYSLVSCLL